MGRKGFISTIIIGLVAAIAIVGVTGYFVFIQKTSTPPGTQKPLPAPQEESGIESAMAKIPTVDLEATIITLSIDPDEDNCAERCSGSEYPQDSAIIKVNKIDDSNDPQGTVKLAVGDEIRVKFRYSARPAKLLRDPALAEQPTSDEPETPVTYTTYLARPIPIEKGYFIYYLPIPKEAEKTLSGLEEGNQIKVTNFHSIFGIGEYEIIP